MNKTIITALAFMLLLQGCATTELKAPPAPCASTTRDCGPAKPLNTAVAMASPGLVGLVVVSG